MSRVVLYLDDEGRWVSNRSIFDTLEKAERYAAGINQSRQPTIMTLSNDQDAAMRRLQDLVH